MDDRGIAAGPVDDLVGNESGVAMDVSSAPQRPADEAGILQRVSVAEVRETHGSEVMHAGNRGGTPSRRHHVVRPVHDIDATRPPFDRRPVDAPPQRSGSASGQRPSAGRPASPRHGELDRIDAALSVERVDESGGELTDTGPVADQRRCVNRHSEHGHRP